MPLLTFLLLKSIDNTAKTPSHRAPKSSTVAQLRLAGSEKSPGLSVPTYYVYYSLRMSEKHRGGRPGNKSPTIDYNSIRWCHV